MTEWTKVNSTDEIVGLLKKANVPCVRIPTFDEVCNDNQLKSRKMIINVEQTISGKVKVPGSVFKLSRTPGVVGFPAPYLGEHNNEVYSDLLGYSEHEIAELADNGII